MANFNIIGLGGLDEKGKNMYTVETDGKIFILDAGHKYPTSDIFGVDLVIPNVDYLEKNKNKIAGIFITHAHDDNDGALPYIMEKLGNPTIYTSPFAAVQIRIVLEKSKKKATIVEVDFTKSIKFGAVEVKTFQLTHTYPQHFGIAIKSGDEQVVYATDFIIDPQSKRVEYMTNMDRINQIASEAKTVALMLESVNAATKGFVAPTHSIKKYAERAINKAEGRLIIGAYDQKVFQLKEMIEEAVKAQKKICIYGRTIDKLLIDMQKRGWLNVPDHLKVPFSEIDKHNNIVIFVLGTAERLYAKLSKIANGEDEFLTLKETDSVLVTAAPVPGSEKLFSGVLDDFYKQDINAKGLKKKHVGSAHAAQEDLKTMIRWFKPENIVAIKGQYRHQVELEKVAKDMGFDEKHILMPRNGDTYSYSNGIFARGKRVEYGDVLVDGLGVGDIGAVVVRERSIMANDGVIICGFTIDRKTKKIIAGPDIQMRGFMFIGAQSKPISEFILQTFKEKLEEGMKSKKFDWSVIRDDVRRTCQKHIRKQTKKMPIFLPVILEV